MEPAKKLNWLQSSPSLGIIGGLSVLFAALAVVYTATLDQHSSAFHKVMSVVSLWLLWRVPGLWSRDDRSGSDSTGEPKWFPFLDLGISIAVFAASLVLLRHMIWAFTPDLARIVTAMAGLYSTIPSCFVWTALGVWAGVVLANSLRSRD